MRSVVDVARALYRLGRAVAAHAGRVALAWGALLAISLGLMLGFGGQLSSSLTLEGIPSIEIVDRLKTTFPEAARGSGQVVFRTEDDQPFTDSQRTSVSDTLASIAALPGVAATVDPFTTQAQLDDARAQAVSAAEDLTTGATDLEAGQAKLDDGRTQLAQAVDDLDAAQAKIDDGRATVEDKLAELDAGQAKLDDGRTQLAKAVDDLDAAQAKIDAGRTQIAAQQSALDAGLAKLDAAIAQSQSAGQPTADLEAQRAQLVAGQAKLDAATAELDAGQGTVDAGRATITDRRAELTAGQRQLDAGRTQLATAVADLDDGQAEVDRGRATIAEKQRELTEGQTELTEGQATLDQGRVDLAVGQRLVAASEGFRTVSEDGSTAVATVQFEQPSIEVESSTREAVVATIEEAPIPGVQVELSKDLTTMFDSILGLGELIGLAVAGLVLVIMLGTLIGAGLPLLAAVLGVGVSASLSLSLASVVDMTSTTPVLGVMLGLAVGIDYSLFILNRHRRQLRGGMDLHESIGVATGTSGGAVLFAGMTVVIALLALNLTGIGFLGLMGSVGAFAIVVAVLAALTFTPAMLRLAGRRVLRRSEREALAQPVDHTADSEPRHALEPVLPSRHPWLSILVGSVIVFTLSIPALGLRLGLPDGSTESADSTQYRAYTITSEAFGAGVNGPIAAIATFPEPIAEADELATKADLADALMDLDNVAAVVPAAVSEDRTTLLLQVIPTYGPASVETEQLVHDIRGIAVDIAAKTGADLGITGMAAANIDISAKLADAMPTYLITVLVLSVLLLIAVFRSIAVPILASAGFLATVLATFGAVVAVFQNGWLGFLFGVHDPGPILSFLPIILIGVLFGLAMDYQLFVTSGIREAHIHGMDADSSIRYGLHLSRGVVAAAAVIMIFVFGSFTFSELAMIRPIGFGLAVGVLIDAFLVRLVLIPAVLSLLGERAWWLPRWLDRILPELDIEGSALERDRLH